MDFSKKEQIVALLEQAGMARDKRQYQEIMRAHAKINALISLNNEEDEGDLDEDIVAFIEGRSTLSCEEMADTLIERYARRN